MGNAQVTAQQLNSIYYPLDMKACQLLHGLFHRIFEPKLSYYSGNYYRTEDGECRKNAYPIPVVTVTGYCEIEVDLERVLVSAKLRRADALGHTYKKLEQYEFEAYDAEDYETAYRLPGMTIEDMKENIQNSKANEIGFSFRFGHDIDGNSMYEFVKLLRREGFFC